MTDTPEISVVIPCRNGATTLGRQLDALLGQTQSTNFEIIVANNGSTDDTVSLVHSYAERDPRIRLVDASRRRGINVARNVGVSAARAPLVVLCDSDDVVHDGWLRAYVDAYANGFQSGGGSTMWTTPDGEVFDIVRDLYTLQLGGLTLASPVGANCGFSKVAWETAGGFEEDVNGGHDETYFFFRLSEIGFKVSFVPGATITYFARSDARSLWRQYRGRGRAEVDFYRRYRDLGLERNLRLKLGIGGLTSLLKWSIDAARKALRGEQVSQWERGAPIRIAATHVGRITRSAQTRTLYL